jgi:hypothetical protein
MNILDYELAVTVFSIHLERTTVREIVNFSDLGQFKSSQSPRPVATKRFNLHQEFPATLVMAA